MAVTVNGALISEAAIDDEVDRLRPHYDAWIGDRASVEDGGGSDEARLREWAEENLVEAELLHQAERREPVELPAAEIDAAMREVEARYGGREKFERCMAVTPENVEQLRAEVVRGLRAVRFVERLTADVRAPSGAEIQRWYASHPKRFQVPEQIRARHIVKNDVVGADAEALIEPLRRAKAELERGADFAQVADRWSDCSGNGGDLGIFARGRMVASFEDAVLALEPGGISDIFRTEFGWHIAQLVGRWPARTLALADVRDAVSHAIMEERRQSFLEQRVDGLKARASIIRVPPVTAGLRT